ncbi:hypothetical protein CRE_15832 [Caenorhabditis remanei]|uniref:Peptidase S9 prolyl oligopeptidase catalytic domain-containing protein n=1 Tax=Caenorhabditis remanei TaxID=31234 RepID=E3NRX6_CAERE|nr:hypothetical protein CRE_15832 [Caenorhabditis remanei]
MSKVEFLDDYFQLHSTEMIAYSLAIDTLSIHKLRFCRPSIVVDVNNDEMLFETVAANSHSRLWISSLSTGIEKTEFSATLLTGKRATDEQMFNFNVKPVDFDNGEYTGILSVHPLLSVLINWGHAILVVNHREPFVVHPDSDLPDFATSQDIDDFHNAVVKVLSDHRKLDENYVCLYGYMYGSFVAANVIKRHPNFYKCAAFVHPILDYPYIPENEDEDDEEDQEPLDILESREITIPTFLVLPKDDDHEDYQKYRQLAAKGVQCFGHSELEDEESHDYIVKILHFFKYPYDAFPRRVDDVQSAVEEAAAKN